MSRRINRDDVERLHDVGIYIPQRTIYMGSDGYDENGDESGCDALMAERAIKNLFILDKLSNEPITILFNNIGGDLNHGLAIYDAIKTCTSHVTIVVYGHAHSMGSVILQAADERIMAPNSVQMIHYGTLGVQNHGKTVLNQVKENERLDVWMERMYLDKIRKKQPGYKISRLKKLLNHDTFLTAKESVELGLADKVLGE